MCLIINANVINAARAKLRSLAIDSVWIFEAAERDPMSVSMADVVSRALWMSCEVSGNAEAREEDEMVDRA